MPRTKSSGMALTASSSSSGVECKKTPPELGGVFSLTG